MYSSVKTYTLLLAAALITIARFVTMRCAATRCVGAATTSTARTRAVYGRTRCMSRAATARCSASV